MPPYALQLLIALVLVGLTAVLHFPLEIGPLEIGAERSVDALDAALLALALVNLRVAWSAAGHAGGGRAPTWFVVLGLLTAALITYAMVRALTPVAA